MIPTLSRACRVMATSATAVSISLMLAPAAHASGSSMPWEAPLQSILQSIEGPVAKIIAVIVIIATGLALAFGDTSGGFRHLHRRTGAHRIARFEGEHRAVGRIQHLGQRRRVGRFAATTEHDRCAQHEHHSGSRSQEAADRALAPPATFGEITHTIRQQR